MGWVRNATGKISAEPQYIAATLEEACQKVADNWNNFKAQPRCEETYDPFPAPFTTRTCVWKQRYGGDKCPRGDTVIVVIAANGNEFCRYIYRPTDWA